MKVEEHVVTADERIRHVVFHVFISFTVLNSEFELRMLVFAADIDECQDESRCVRGQCLNTDGSYMCFCTSPMVLDPAGSHCILPPELAGEFITYTSA